MRIVLVAVAVCCSAIDLQKMSCGVEGAFRANASVCSSFSKGLGWFGEASVFVLKKDVVTVPNHKYLGMVSCVPLHCTSSRNLGYVPVIPPAW